MCATEERGCFSIEEASTYLHDFSGPVFQRERTGMIFARFVTCIWGSSYPEHWLCNEEFWHCCARKMMLCFCVSCPITNVEFKQQDPIPLMYRMGENTLKKKSREEVWR